MSLQPNVIFNDNMVLQRRKPVRIYGSADPGARIDGTLAGVRTDTTAGADGTWELVFGVMEAGGPWECSVSDGSETITYRDVYTGDVWLCAGQSNMVIPMQRLRFTYPREIASPYDGPVRMLTVVENPVFEGPAENLPHGNWQRATAETFAAFSAVAWFFGCMINREEGVPVGLIVSAVGGTPIQSWLSKETLSESGQQVEDIEALRSEAARKELSTGEQNAADAWFKEMDRKDPGLSGVLPWHDPGYDCSSWDTAVIPEGEDWVPWEPMGEGDRHGSYWFSRDIDIDASMAGKEGLLALGRIIDADTVWLNGEFAGATGYQYPPRMYPIGEGRLKEGKNRITVRVVSQNSPWAFVPDKPYYLEAGGKRLSLEGGWKFRPGAVMGAFPPSTRFVVKPECLFNGMVAPLVRTPLKGVLWYQGESNVGDGTDYGQFLRLLMDSWRRAWNEPDLPFIIAQLPAYGPASSDTYDSGWAAIREIQRRVSGEPGVALATTLDLGEWNDIHPLHKRPVGERMASAALSLVYGRGDMHQAPKPVETLRDSEGRVRIRFSNAPGGLVVQGGPAGKLHLFAKGSSGGYRRVSGSVEGEWLSVDLHEDQQPGSGCTLRYAWADNPEGAYLYSRAGFPVSPFQLSV